MIRHLTGIHSAFVHSGDFSIFGASDDRDHCVGQVAEIIVFRGELQLFQRRQLQLYLVSGETGNEHSCIVAACYVHRAQLCRGRSISG